MSEENKPKKNIKEKDQPKGDTNNSEQAPLVLVNLLSSGMSMKDAKEKLGIK